MIIEKLNRFISSALDSSDLDEKELKPLDKKNIAIKLSNTSTVIYIEIVEGKILLSEKIAGEPHLILEGSPISFVNYFNNISSDHNIKISGQALLAEHFSKIFKKINIDWEQVISEYTNDEFAFYANKIFCEIKNKKNEVENSILRNTREYIRDETNIFPSKEQIDNYVNDVDSLRNKIDFLEAKFKKFNAYSMNQIFRLIRIYIIIMKNSLDKDLFNFKYLWLLKILRIFFPNLWFRKFNPSRGERLKKTFEELGPIFVKLGQTISTRKDLLPSDIANELVKLQDKVTPFSGEIAKQEVEKALEDKVENIFEEFDINPLASASVAQVHAATLNQNKVIVKVLRPGISKLIKKDISLMYFIANTIDRIWDESKRLKPKEIVGEYEKVIFGELDLIKEASNANLLKKNLKIHLIFTCQIYTGITQEKMYL